MKSILASVQVLSLWRDIRLQILIFGFPDQLKDSKKLAASWLSFFLLPLYWNIPKESRKSSRDCLFQSGQFLQELTLIFLSGKWNIFSLSMKRSAATLKTGLSWTAGNNKNWNTHERRQSAGIISQQLRESRKISLLTVQWNSRVAHTATSGNL